METPQPPPSDYRANVDTSRPFSSVKEAVAIFGERLLVGDIYSFNSPKPYNTTITNYYSTTSSSPNPKEEEKNILLETLKKLEVEFEETKKELKKLKFETGVAVASLNAELHKNLSKLAQAEAVAAKKAIDNIRNQRSDLDGEIKYLQNNERSVIDSMRQTIELRQMANKMVMKKKPIVPLVGDLWFFKKKSSSSTLRNSLFASSDKIWS